MMGPFDEMFGNTSFDLDKDGHIDAGEWSLINDTLYSDDAGSDDDEFDDFEDDLDMAGLSRDELEMMDPDERRDALEEAGFDIDDFDDFDDEF